MPSALQGGIVRKDALKPKVPSFSTSNDAGPWRRSAKDDLEAIADTYGADLGSVVAPEMSYEEAQALVRESGVILPGFDDTIQECGLSDLEASHFQFWEFFSGSCNATIAFLEEYERKLAYLHRLQGINASFEAAVLPVQKDEVSAASGGGHSSRLRHRAQFT